MSKASHTPLNLTWSPCLGKWKMGLLLQEAEFVGPEFHIFPEANYLIFPEPVARNHVATFKSLTNFRYPVFSSLILQNSRDFSNIPKMGPFSPASDWRAKHNGFMVEQFTPILRSIPFVGLAAGSPTSSLQIFLLIPAKRKTHQHVCKKWKPCLCAYLKLMIISKFLWPINQR